MLTVLAVWATIARDYLADRTRALAGESGQDFIEYALVIGVISLVIIFAFVTTGVDAAVKDLVDRIGCGVQGLSWQKGTGCI